jgi:hypothetical protein
LDEAELYDWVGDGLRTGRKFVTSDVREEKRLSATLLCTSMNDPGRAEAFDLFREAIPIFA